MRKYERAPDTWRDGILMDLLAEEWLARYASRDRWQPKDREVEQALGKRRMTDRQQASLLAQEHFERLWRAGDPWETETSEFEQAKYAHQLKAIDDRRYPRALELGCGSGSFTALLATIADHVVAVDIAESAVARARKRLGPREDVEFHAADIVEWDFSGDRFDLITLSDTVSCLGAAYSFLDIGCLAAAIFIATAAGGRLLLANTYGGVRGPLFRPWLTETYRDLFVHVGYRLEKEELFMGVKDEIEIGVLISVLLKAEEDAEEREQRIWW
jgi:SAM-dependent methyltransferase